MEIRKRKLRDGIGSPGGLAEITEIPKPGIAFSPNSLSLNSDLSERYGKDKPTPFSD